MTYRGNYFLTHTTWDAPMDLDTSNESDAENESDNVGVTKSRRSPVEAGSAALDCVRHMRGE